MKAHYCIPLLMLLAACTPADQQYCNRFGVSGTAEYGNCLSYYHRQQNAFDADRTFCDAKADETYPRTLYDYGRQEPVFYGGSWAGRGGPWGPRSGGYTGWGSQYIPPNPAHNAQVDALRDRILNPCMDARGWNAPDSWQAGRHAASKRAPYKARTEILPWQ